MADYLLPEVEVSSNEEFENTEVIDSVSTADLDFTNDDVSVGDVPDFYRQANKKLLLGVEDEVPAPVIKHNVGKLRIDSDSESEYNEEEEVLVISNSEQVELPEEFKIIIPERMQDFYGTDNYEWNHYKLPEGEVYKFPRVNKYMKLFLKTLFTSIAKFGRKIWRSTRNSR